MKALKNELQICSSFFNVVLAERQKKEFNMFVFISVLCHQMRKYKDLMLVYENKSLTL